MTKKKTPQAVWIVAVVALLLVIVIAGYFALVSPQRGQASDLTKQIADTQKQIDDARALALKAKNAEKVRVADIFKLTKAMPDAPDEAGVLLDLNGVAERSGIKFDSVTVEPSTALTSYQVIPLQLEFHGNFYDLADFLFRLRNLVDVHRGALDARGRLFGVDKLALEEGVYTFPMIRAQITITAFIYGTGSPGDAALPASTTPGATTTTTTTTTPTPPPPTGNVAAAGAPR